MTTKVKTIFPLAEILRTLRVVEGATAGIRPFGAHDLDKDRMESATLEDLYALRLAQEKVTQTADKLRDAMGEFDAALWKFSSDRAGGER